jgi:hypothetical protein
MELDPRERLSRTVKSRSQAPTWLRGALRCACGPAATLPQRAGPRSACRALARATPRLWPHVKPLLTGWFERLHGSGLQRRGPCPFHDQAANHQHTFSVHLGKNVFQCFHAACAAHGNVLDFWAAYHRLPLYAAALHLADTFHLPRNREEEPVK